jgi:hypothetical protein
LKTQWIRFRVEEAVEDVGQIYGVPLAEQTEDEKYYREAIEKIVRLLLDKKVYDISQLPDIVGNEGIEYHYGILLNKERLIATLPEIYDILIEYRDKSAALRTRQKSRILLTKRQPVSQTFLINTGHLNLKFQSEKR